MDARLEAWRSRGEFLEVDGRRIFWWEQGSDRPVLALHGFPASSYDWRFVADLLPDFRFIAFDLPGFGLSDKSPSGDYTLDGYATVAERLLAHLDLYACDGSRSPTASRPSSSSSLHRRSTSRASRLWHCPQASPARRPAGGPSV